MQKFTLEEHAKFKAADPDDVVCVRVCETIEFIEQYEQLSKDYARVTADKVRLEEDKVRLQEDNAGLQEDKVRLEEDKVRLEEDKVGLQEDKVRLEEDKVGLQEDKVRLEEEIAEYKSNVAVLEQRISDLDRSSKLNSHNSSKPPSSDGLSKETVDKKKKEKRTKSSRKKSDRKSGGQAGHKGTTLNQVENPDQIVDHTPDQCQECSATLSKSDIVGFSSRQVFDIPKPPPLFVTEHRAHTCQCSECGAKVRAAFPDGVNAPVQYGNEIASLVAYLQTTQCLPDHRTAMLLSEWWDIKISSGTVANLTARKAQEFRGAHTHLYDILSGKLVAVKHLDETGIRVAGRLEWLHILCSRFLSHLRLGERRGDIPRDLEGTVIHDCLSPYFTMENVRHGVCNQHLIRELTAAHEIDGEPWAAEMKVILYEARDLAEAARNAGQNAVDPVAIAKIERLYAACWGKAIKYHEGLPPLPRLSNKGPKKKRKAHNLALRFQHYKDMVLLFLHDLSVPFTNNEAEQGLRMPKVREKVSGCFRTKKGMENYCILRSVTETGRKQGRGTLDTLRAGPAVFIKLLNIA